MVAPWIRTNQPPRKKAPAETNWTPSQSEVKSAEPSEPEVVVVEEPPPLVEEPPPLVEAAEEIHVDEQDLSKLRKGALVVLAQERGIDAKGYTKAQLIELLNN